MDTIDGIYAGKKRRLKAMKDSRVGAFSVQALILITFIQFASLLKLQTQIVYILPICLFLGRFSTLIYIEKFKYITYKKKSISHKKYWRGFFKEAKVSLLVFFAISFVLVKLFVINIFTVLLLSLIGLFYCWLVINFLGSKIKGFNGDTCGASVVLVETIMLFTCSIIL